MRRDVGSIPTRGAKEVITMRGSRIAKEIEREIKREQARREKLLEMLMRRRGESNERRRDERTSENIRE